MDALRCIQTRRSVPRLVEPAPDEATVRRLLEAATCAPDHGELRPWHFLVITGEGLVRLGEVFADAHRAAEPDADAGALEKTAAKTLRAPMVIAVISRPVEAGNAWNGKDVPAWEQLAATAAAAQNLCLAAHAEGFGTMWRTGWFGDAPVVREALGLGEHDTVVGWIYIGTTPETANVPPRRDVPLESVASRWP